MISYKYKTPNSAMRKRLLFIAFIILTVSSNILDAQTGKGKFLFGEFSYIKGISADVLGTQNIGYTVTQFKSDLDGGDPVKTRIISFNLVPEIGYFVVDNLALGLDFMVSSGFRKSSDDTFKYNSTLLSAGPFVRYYIPAEKVLPFAEAFYSRGSNKVTSDYFEGENTYRSTVQYYGLGLGISIPLGEKVSFDTLVGYIHSSTKEKENNEYNDRHVVDTFGLKLGFSVYLGSGKGD